MRASAGRYAVKPSRSLNDIVQAAAMHEAGHVVAAVVLGYGVRFAILRIHQDDNERVVGGYTETTLAFLGPVSSEEHARTATTTPEALHIQSVQTLAGCFAESVVNGDHDDIERGSEDDVKRVMEFAMHAHSFTPADLEDVAILRVVTDYIEKHENDACALLTPMLPSIIRVANHLIAHPNDEVPGEVLKSLICDDEPNHDQKGRASLQRDCARHD